MIKLSNKLKVISFTILLTSCYEREQKSDLVVTANNHTEIKEVYDKAGRLIQKYQTNLIGEKNGFFYEYYSNGKIKSTSYYKRDVLDSIQKWFYHNGFQEAELFRIAGKKFGMQKLFDSGGNLEQVYFVTSSCDTCITSFLTFNSDGSIKEKKGNLINCIFSDTTIKRNDTAKIIFYALTPDNYTSSGLLIEEGADGKRKVQPGALDVLNNNKGFLFAKTFDKVGHFRIGFSLNISNPKATVNLSDSMFLSLKVIE